MRKCCSFGATDTFMSPLLYITNVRSRLPQGAEAMLISLVGYTKQGASILKISRYSVNFD